jgi:hypothetical protein
MKQYIRLYINKNTQEIEHCQTADAPLRDDGVVVTNPDEIEITEIEIEGHTEFVRAKDLMQQLTISGDSVSIEANEKLPLSTRMKNPDTTPTRKPVRDIPGLMR